MASQEPQPFHWRYPELDDRDLQIRGRTLFSIVVLVAFILLITLLFIYARWVCRLRLLLSASSDLPHAPPSQPQPQPPQGLHPSTINSFPIILHNSSTMKTVDDSECCICLGIFQNEDKVKVLPKCHHCYHSDCVDRWLTAHSSCPLCRSSLRADSAV
ncbi:unnamed protein product [Camellia sinensis]